MGQHRVAGEVGMDTVAIELKIKSVGCTLLQTAVFSMDDAKGARRHYCATPGSTANAVTRVQIRGLVSEWSVWAPVIGAMDMDSLCTPPSPELCDSGKNEVPLFENVFTGVNYECRCKEGFYLSQGGGGCIVCSADHFCPAYTNSRFTCPARSKQRTGLPESSGNVYLNWQSYCVSSAGFYLKNIYADIGSLLQSNNDYSVRMFYTTHACPLARADRIAACGSQDAINMQCALARATMPQSGMDPTIASPRMGPLGARQVGTVCEDGYFMSGVKRRVRVHLDTLEQTLPID